MIRTVTLCAAALQSLLFAKAEAAAQAVGLVQRRRRLSGAQWVQTLVFGWMRQPDATLEDLTDEAARLGAAITPQGLDAWFVPEAAECLKSLSQNPCRPPGDPGAGEVEEGFVIGDFFLPADQQSSEAVHPTMRPLHHPAPRPIPGDLLPRLRLGPPALLDRDVGCVTPAGHQLPHRGVVIPLVPQKVLWLLRRGLGSLDRDAVQGGFDQFHVGPVGPGHLQAQRHASAVRQQRTLRALFGPIGGVLARLFSPRAGPWSWSRPGSAIPSRCRPCRRTRARPFATAGGTAPAFASVGSSGADCCRSRTRAGRPSSGRRYAGRRKCHPTPGVGAKAAVPPCGSGAPWATGVRCVPRGRPGYGKYRQPFHEKRP